MKATPMVWTGRALSALFVLFMLGASIAPKFLFRGPDLDAYMSSLGWDPSFIVMIGVIELVCVLLYLFPGTSVLGAILMTGLLGGAMATHVRVESPLFTHTLFGLYLALFMWGGLWLRDPALRALFPWRK